MQKFILPAIVVRSQVLHNLELLLQARMVHTRLPVRQLFLKVQITSGLPMILKLLLYLVMHFLLAAHK